MKKEIAIVVITLLLGCNGSSNKKLESTGTIEATEVTISAQVGGPIKKIIAEEGDHVKVGDTLLIIDNTDWLLQYEQAKAGFEMSEAQYMLVLRGSREEDLIQAEANFKNAEADLKRMEELYNAKSISEKQLDDARTRFTIAQQTLEKLKRGARQEEIIAARAKRDQAKAQMEMFKKKVNDCNVLSPVSGTITKRFVEEGELAGTGTALYRIADYTSMDITIYLSEVDIPKVNLGQKAIVRIDSFNRKDFEGQVIYISSTAEFTPKNIQTREERTKLVFAVKIKVPNPDNVLKAGIPADVILEVPNN